MNKNDYRIRLETPADYAEVEKNARAMESFFWIILSKGQQKWVQVHYALREILIFMEKAALPMRPNMDYRDNSYNAVPNGHCRGDTPQQMF